MISKTPDPLRIGRLLVASAALLLAGALSLQAQPAGNAPREAAPESARVIAVPNAGFELGAQHWDFSAAQGIASVSKEAAAAGAQGLRIESSRDDTGLFVASERIPVDHAMAYRLAWRGRVLAGDGTCIYLRFLDATGREIFREEGRVNNDKGLQWVGNHLNAIPPQAATTMDIVVQRPGWRPPVYTVELDEFELSARPIAAGAPWTGTYKLRADETERLTAADVVAPDGRVYPDWRMAGVPGGIPRVPTVQRLEDLGAKPGEDISALLEAAAKKVASSGGGAIEIGEGVFHLDEPVMIFDSNVVIRGAGSDKTRLLFRYQIPYGEIRFFRIKPGQEMGRNTVIEFHTNPKDLVAIELRAGERVLRRDTRKDHWGDTFSLRVSTQQALGELGEGPQLFTAIAEYADGKRVTQEIELILTGAASGETTPVQLGAINFVGRGLVSERRPLAADGRRGDRVLAVGAEHPFVVGDKINLVAPASERWRKLVGHESHWAIQAQCLYEVVAVDQSSVTIHQVLRTPFLVEDGSYVQKVQMVSGSGVEGVYLEQIVVPNQGPRGPFIGATLWHAIEDLWTSGVIYSYGWGCWMRDVTVRNTGRNSAYFPMSKHIEVRDCLFDDALFKGGGGTGYIGFDRSWDCLMENIEVRGMRHAPNSQWNASGNVVRNSRFLGSDGQWHAGFTLENLYENNFIDARGKGGSYGHGLYASGPSSGIHGPQGPRNVAYRNDILSRKDGLHMLGGNEAWLVLYNRFAIGAGHAVFAKEKSFDHVIAGNVFVLRQAKTPAVFLGADSVGVELVDNSFYGVTPPMIGFAGGRTQLALAKGNVVHAEVPDEMPPLPEPAIPSIFQWQRNHTSPAGSPPASPASP